MGDIKIETNEKAFKDKKLCLLQKSILSQLGLKAGYVKKLNCYSFLLSLITISLFPDMPGIPGSFKMYIILRYT